MAEAIVNAQLGAAGDEQRAELERLRSTYLALPIVAAYLQAEADLRIVCQAANGILSQAVGLDMDSPILVQIVGAPGARKIPGVKQRTG